MLNSERERKEEAGFQALTEGCAVIDLPRRERLFVSGEDRGRFVNGLVTSDLRQVEPGHGYLGFFTSREGRILSDVVAWAHTDTLELDVSAGRGEKIAEHMLAHRVADRVEIELGIDQEEKLFAGPAALELLSEAIQGPVPTGFWECRRAGGIGIFSEGWLGVPLFRIRGSADSLSEISAKLRAAGSEAAGADVVDAVRIERGRPWFGVDYDEKSLPQETGLELEAVSFSKGCYLGQEIVARIHYRGRVNRRLRGLCAEEGGGLAVGDDVLLGGQVVGTVSTRAFSPRFQTWTALATLSRSAEPGSVVQLRDGTRVKVVDVPFADCDSSCS